MGSHLLLQGIFPTQKLNLRLLHWQTDSLRLSHQGSHHHHDFMVLFFFSFSFLSFLKHRQNYTSCILHWTDDPTVSELQLYWTRDSAETLHYLHLNLGQRLLWQNRTDKHKTVPFLVKRSSFSLFVLGLFQRWHIWEIFRFHCLWALT